MSKNDIKDATVRRILLCKRSNWNLLKAFAAAKNLTLGEAFDYIMEHNLKVRIQNALKDY